MNKEVRGRHLVSADRAFATGGFFARLLAGGFHRILDRIDADLAEGAIEATLPDGSRRLLGGRKSGPVPIVHLASWRALVRLVGSGSVGWYKAWERGEWSSPDPVPLFDLFMRNAEPLGDVARSKGMSRMVNRAAHALRRNRPANARRNIAFHYDLGNDFYGAWLDDSMTYSSAMFASDGESLEAAQARKIEALLDRLDLAPGQSLLDIGCGWGALAIAAARRGICVTGLTLSAEQKALAEASVAEVGVVDHVEIRLQDYRHISQRFDAVASVEMVEAVGEEYWPAWITAIANALKPGGRAAIQYIAIREPLFEAYRANPDFIQAYVFPGGMLISETRLRALAEGAGLSWQDRFGFGPDYAETLLRWRRRYDAAVAEGRLPGFDPAFHRLWRYYLMYSEGGFRGGGIDVAQVTLVKSAAVT